MLGDPGRDEGLDLAEKARTMMLEGSSVRPSSGALRHLLPHREKGNRRFL